MAHEISIREDGFAEFACTKTPAWHGLGQMLEVGADLATWKRSAGMDWEVFESAVSYNSMTGSQESSLPLRHQGCSEHRGQ